MTEVGPPHHLKCLWTCERYTSQQRSSWTGCVLFIKPTTPKCRIYASLNWVCIAFDWDLSPVGHKAIIYAIYDIPPQTTYVNKNNIEIKHCSLIVLLQILRLKFCRYLFKRRLVNYENYSSCKQIETKCRLPVHFVDVLYRWQGTNNIWRIYLMYYPMFGV